MAKFNQEKAVSANSNGIVISFRDVNKHQFIKYEIPYVKEVQLNGTVKYQKIEEVPFTPKQKELYLKVIYGFNGYTEKEMSWLPERVKAKISNRFVIAQRILNKWKQEILFEGLDGLLLSLFPHSKVIKQIISTKGICLGISSEDEISFKELGITKIQIAEKLIKHNLLPQDFFQLTI